MMQRRPKEEVFTLLASICASIGVPYVALIIIVITLIVFALDKFPIGAVAMAASILLGITGCMSLTKVYSGWSSSLVIMLLGMMVVGYSMFKTGVVVLVGNAMRRSKLAQSERGMMILVMLISGGLSSVLSNTATVATFIPLIGAMVAASGGKLHNKFLLMPLGYAAAIGGTLTLIGSTSQPMVNTVLEQNNLQLLGMLDFVPAALPAFLIMMVWMSTIGYAIMKKTCTFDDVSLSGEDDAAIFNDFKPTYKTWISAGVMVFCVVGFVSGLWNTAVIAIVGAAIVILTGCVGFKDSMLYGVEWNTIFIMAFAQGIAAGMNDSGAGEMIARFFVDLMGSNALLQLLACIIVVTVLTNIMSNTAVAAMMTPIYLLICAELGVSYYPFCMAIAIASNLTTATPIGGTAVSMVLQGGYRFRDFVKVGLPLNILMMISVMIMCPILWPL